MVWARVKQQLQWWHRWLGVVLCVPIVLWFVSGAILLFVPYPQLQESERLAGAAPLDLSQVRLGADAASAAAGMGQPPASARLGALEGRPVWRLRGPQGEVVVVDAVDGVAVAPLDATRAVAVGRAFQQRAVGGDDAVRHLGVVERDQWTVNGLRGLAPPLHRIGVADGRVLYVSQQAADVVRDASWNERTWGWPGAVLHWIYVTPLRANAPLWTQLVLWLSGVSLVVAFSGLLIGLWRSVDAWRRRRRISAYRGIHYWHHILGWAGGGLVLTWMFSGWMSMSPFEAAPNPAVAAWREAWSGVPVQWPSTALRPPSALPQAGLVEVELRWLAGEPWYRGLSRDGRASWQHAGSGRAGAPDPVQLLERVSAGSGQHIARRELLTRYDAYYVSHPHRDPRPLPVWRIVLDDAQQTWVHVAPERMEIASLLDRARRGDRWLYSGLHSWDLPWLLARPALRNGLLLAALALGLALSVTGFVVGWKRLCIQRLAGSRRRG